MKFEVMFKTPDAVDFGVSDLDEEQQAAAKQFAANWVRYGELVTIQFDTVEETAKVVEV